MLGPEVTWPIFLVRLTYNTYRLHSTSSKGFKYQNRDQGHVLLHFQRQLEVPKCINKTLTTLLNSACPLTVKLAEQSVVSLHLVRSFSLHNTQGMIFQLKTLVLWGNTALRKPSRDIGLNITRGMYVCPLHSTGRNFIGRRLTWPVICYLMNEWLFCELDTWRK